MARKLIREPDERCTSQGASAALAIVKHEAFGLGRRVQVQLVQDPARLQAIRLACKVHEVRHESREWFQARDQLLIVEGSSEGPAQDARASSVLIVKFKSFFSSGGRKASHDERAGFGSALDRGFAVGLSGHVERVIGEPSEVVSFEFSVFHVGRFLSGSDWARQAETVFGRTYPKRVFTPKTVHHIPSYIIFFPDYLSDHALDSYDHFSKNDPFVEISMTYDNNCLQQMSITFQICFFPEILFKVGGVDVDSCICLEQHL